MSAMSGPILHQKVLVGVVRCFLVWIPVQCVGNETAAETEGKPLEILLRRCPTLHAARFSRAESSCVLQVFKEKFLGIFSGQPDQSYIQSELLQDAFSFFLSLHIILVKLTSVFSFSAMYLFQKLLVPCVRGQGGLSENSQSCSVQIHAGHLEVFFPCHHHK